MSAATIKQRLPVPALVGTAFGGLWSVLGAMALPHQRRVPAIVVGLLVTAVLVVERCRKAASGSSLFRRRAYVVAVALEVAGLYLAMSLLKRYGLEAFFVQALGFVVGLHFIGLWMASGQRRYLWLCVSMCVVSLMGALLPSASSGHFNVRNAFTAYGCAVALWVAARPTRGLADGQASADPP
jgi:hypothetical protein